MTMLLRCYLILFTPEYPQPELSPHHHHFLSFFPFPAPLLVLVCQCALLLKHTSIYTSSNYFIIIVFYTGHRYIYTEESGISLHE